MTTRAPSWTLFIATAMLSAGSAHAADDVPLAKDLSAVIALQGMPCGQVVSATQQRDNDYLAACDDGHRYRVFINADGRVVVEKQPVSTLRK